MSPEGRGLDIYDLEHSASPKPRQRTLSSTIALTSLEDFPTVACVSVRK